jgi:hypothetical protein
MIRKYLSRKRKPRKIQRLPDELEVQSGLVKTPTQVYYMSQSGIPVKLNQSSEGYALGENESVHNELSIHDKRSVDINEVWTEQQKSRSKIKDYKKSIQEPKEA